MDTKDVPKQLSKVVMSSARVLPPPLERPLFDALESDDVFRGMVADRWAADGQSDQLVEAFLTDPESSRVQLKVLALEAAVEKVTGDLAKAEQIRRALEEDLGEAKRRTAAMRKETKAELAEAKAADKRARKSLETATRNAQAEADDAVAAQELLTDRLADVETQLAAMTAERNRLKARRTPPPPRSVGADIRTDAVGVAIQLDRLERRLRPFRAGQDRDAVEAEPLTAALPPGVTPDAAEAVAAALSMDVDVVIDGYNLGGLIEFDEFSKSRGREAVIAIAERMRRQSSGKVTVVFDAVDVDGRTSFTTSGGVLVVFSIGESADDRIVDIAAETPWRIVVCTNDRELGVRCVNVGATVIWNDAIVAWKPT